MGFGGHKRNVSAKKKAVGEVGDGAEGDGARHFAK